MDASSVDTGLKSSEVPAHVECAETRLVELDLELPQPPCPIANYVASRRVGPIVYLAGQGSMIGPGKAVLGKINDTLSVEDGVRAAQMAALNTIAQAKLACDGDLGRIVQWTRMTGYVNCTDDFVDHPLVLDGASALLEAVFGERGCVARAAVGVNSLPMGIAVEIQAEFEIAP